MEGIIETWAGQVPLHAMPLRTDLLAPKPRLHIIATTGAIIEFVRAHPWCTSPQLGAHFGRLPRSLTGTLTKAVNRGILERRGRKRFYEYRVA